MSLDIFWCPYLQKLMAILLLLLLLLLLLVLLLVLLLLLLFYFSKNLQINNLTTVKIK